MRVTARADKKIFYRRNLSKTVGNKRRSGYTARRFPAARSRGSSIPAEANPPHPSKLPRCNIAADSPFVHIQTGEIHE
nr:MAG TPA: hypothetical protein [Caudoviricetes sp.]